ncbi:Fc.00g032650.m01.CDS01 [Cosmosporella sp. VM-42]
MDQPDPDNALGEPEKSVLDSWQPRFCQFADAKEDLWLGQHNADDFNTRTKITHVDFLGLGVIGSVCSVTYGTWSESPGNPGNPGSPAAPAALLVMQFDFRAGSGPLRYTSAAISVVFEGQGPGGNRPIIHRVFPTSNNSRSSPSASRSSGLMLPPDPFVWPPDEFTIRGKTWVSAEGVQEPDEVTWKLNETHGSKFGICEPVKLAVIVTHQGPFQATVEATATTALRLIKISNTPWSQDDPLLFDGFTHKGRPLPGTELNRLDPQTLAEYIALASPSSSALSRASSTAVSSLMTAPSTTPERESTPKSSGAVYRVRGIPASCRRGSFIRGLATALSIEPSSIRVHSLTANPYHTGEEMMSVLSFHTIPDILQAKSTNRVWPVDVSLPPEGSESHPTVNTTITLLFDTHFLGFSAVGTTSAVSAEIEVEPINSIVAVHGLGGHAYGSFKERGGSYMWLEDSLPAHLRASWEPLTAGCVARILLYGYDAHIENSSSFQSVHDLASQLRGSLRAIRPGIVSKRPLIFIGHSLGGLMIKELLVIQAEPGGDKMDRFNLEATGGALFFGVPHRGMDNSALLSIIGSQPNREFLESLRAGSPELEKQSQTFSTVSVLAESAIFSFYETCVSGTAKMDNGRLTMNGDPAILVTKDSANHAETSSRFLIPINRSHSELVKFERYSDDYERALGCLREILKATSEIVPPRFANVTP